MLLSLVDTPQVQRLRRIRQLGMAYLVYPGAEHSRFAHSMGVMWLGYRMLERLGRLTEIPEDEQMVTLAACLLHDVGHGPFSHALEAVTGVHHEAYSRDIILSPDTAVGRALREVDPTLPERVAARVEGRGDGPPFLREIVSSQLDADRLDYILRDGHATGVKIGAYDLLRILALLELDGDGHIAAHVGAQEAVEGYLLARFHMYKQVYLHKTSRAAERVLEATLRRAGQLRRDGAGPAYWPAGPLGRLIAGRTLDPVDFAAIDDVDVWVALKAWGGDPDRVLADLAGGLVLRRLWKPLPLPLADLPRAQELVSAARSLARVHGFDPAYAVLVDECEDPVYRPFTGVGPHRKAIRLVETGGRAGYIEDRSEVVKMLGQLTLRQRLLCVHPRLRDRVHKLVTRR
ncbi:MAG: hypothetical protein CSA66_02425 [Proteobacteria bacterium]|nr:MAG: hypothetical protein CSA66_02425 [Pseudomonadota bacterium]